MREIIYDLVNYLLENDLLVCISSNVLNEISLFLLRETIIIKIKEDFTVEISVYTREILTDSKIIHTTKENINQSVFKELLNYL